MFIIGITLFSFTDCTSKPKINTLHWGKAYTENGKVIITIFKTLPLWKGEYDYFNEFKIYRILCSDFTFGVDHEEYFRNVHFKKKDCIFKGKIDPILSVKFKFEDKTAKKDSVYAYWIVSSGGVPYGPLPVKIRDTEVWWPYSKITGKLKQLQNKYPDYVTFEKIGYSVNRRPINALKIGKGKSSIALIGAIHPGESGPELIISALEKLLEQHQDLLKNISIITVPSSNCDVREKLVSGNPWYLRKNMNGVDLNRNFPANWIKDEITYNYHTSDPDGFTYRGPFAGSEPETQAVMNFLLENNPLAVFSCHCLASICGEMLFTCKAAKNDSNYIKLCYKYANPFWDGIDPDMEPQRVKFACTNGSLPAWCYQKLKIPAFDVEAPLNKEDRKKVTHDKTDIVLLKKYQERFFNGILNILKSFE